MTHSSILAIAVVLVAALVAGPASAKPVHSGTGHHWHRVHIHHHVGARAAWGAFGAVHGHFGVDPNSPAATGGGSLGYNRGIYAN